MRPTPRRRTARPPITVPAMAPPPKDEPPPPEEAAEEEAAGAAVAVPAGTEDEGTTVGSEEGEMLLEPAEEEPESAVRFVYGPQSGLGTARGQVSARHRDKSCGPREGFVVIGGAQRTLYSEFMLFEKVVLSCVEKP